VRFGDSLLLGVSPMRRQRVVVARIREASLRRTPEAAITYTMEGTPIDTIAVLPGLADVEFPGTSIPRRAVERDRLVGLVSEDQRVLTMLRTDPESFPPLLPEFLPDFPLSSRASGSATEGPSGSDPPSRFGSRAARGTRGDGVGYRNRGGLRGDTDPARRSPTWIRSCSWRRGTRVSVILGPGRLQGWSWGSTVIRMSRKAEGPSPLVVEGDGPRRLRECQLPNRRLRQRPHRCPELHPVGCVSCGRARIETHRAGPPFPRGPIIPASTASSTPALDPDQVCASPWGTVPGCPADYGRDGSRS